MVAFRKGIHTHHFGRDLFPLEKTKGNIHLTLAMKSFCGDIRSAFGTAVSMIAAGTVMLFCLTTVDFFKDGIPKALVYWRTYNPFRISPFQHYRVRHNNTILYWN